MKHVRSRLIIFRIMVILTVPAISAGISLAGDETFTQLKVVFKSCEEVEASKNSSLPLYEEAICDAKTELEFLRRMGRVSQACLLCLDGFTMSHGVSFANRTQEEDMLQGSRRAVTFSLRKEYDDIAKENKGIAEDAQREAARNLEEAYKNCFPHEDI